MWQRITKRSQRWGSAQVNTRKDDYWHDNCWLKKSVNFGGTKWSTIFIFFLMNYLFLNFCECVLLKFCSWTTLKIFAPICSWNFASSNFLLCLLTCFEIFNAHLVVTKRSWLQAPMGVWKYAKSCSHGKFERPKSFSMVIEVLKGNNVYCCMLVDECFLQNNILHTRGNPKGLKINE